MLLRVDVFLAAETELGAEGMATLAPALGNLVSLTSLNLTGSYAPFVKPWCILEGWHGDVVWVVTLFGVAAENELDAEVMAALAPVLGNLVSLTSLDLHCT